MRTGAFTPQMSCSLLLQKSGNSSLQGIITTVSLSQTALNGCQHSSSMLLTQSRATTLRLSATNGKATNFLYRRITFLNCTISYKKSMKQDNSPTISLKQELDHSLQSKPLFLLSKRQGLLGFHHSVLFTKE